MIVPSGNGSFPSRQALIATSLPKTAAKLWRLPSSWATEINLQSRYPGGISATEMEGPAGLPGFAATASAVMAPELSAGWELAFWACDFLLMMTTEMARAEAMMRVTKQFFMILNLMFCLCPRVGVQWGWFFPVRVQLSD